MIQPPCLQLIDSGVIIISVWKGSIIIIIFIISVPAGTLLSQILLLQVTSANLHQLRVQLLKQQQQRKETAIILGNYEQIYFEHLPPTDFIDDIGRRSYAITVDHRERAFLWQPLSMALQRYNAVCFCWTFTDMAYQSTCDL